MLSRSLCQAALDVTFSFTLLLLCFVFLRRLVDLAMPLPSVPDVADFPRDLHPVIHLPPNNKPTNAIIFFPGLGDTSLNFSSFAKALNLPDAVTISLQPPFPLPFPVGPGFHWSDDLRVETSSGAIDEDSPLTRSTDMIARVVSEVLIKEHHFSPPAIHLLGFRQGGCLALSVPLHDALSGIQSLGGVVSIGGCLPLSTNHATTQKSRTPVCLLGASRGVFSKDEQSSVKRVRSLYEFAEYHEWKKVDDSMPKNREEVLPLMQFFARRLRDRRGVPDDFIEVG